MKTHVIAASHLNAMMMPAPAWDASSAGFQLGRQEVISLMPLDASCRPGYVWRKIFLKGRKQA